VADDVIELLENPRLREEILKCAQDVWSYAGTLYGSPQEDMEQAVEAGLGTLLDEAWWRADSFTDAEQGVCHAFASYVIAKMHPPQRLTLDDLVDTFWNLAKPVERDWEGCYFIMEKFTSEDCENFYRLFVRFVENEVLAHRRSKVFLIGALAGEPVSEEHTVWDKNGVSVAVLPGALLETSLRPGGRKLYELPAVIEGSISESASRKLEQEIPGIVRAAVRSMDLLNSQSVGPDLKVLSELGGSLWLFRREVDGVIWIDPALLAGAADFMKEYLDLYYSQPNKRDSILRRMRNALVLLVQADAQQNAAIKLALYVAAIEALCGDGGAGLTERLSTNVAVLLEPVAERRHAATRVIKGLYELRSRTLHGEQLEIRKEAKVVVARHVAASLLKAMKDRRAFMERSGYKTESLEELLNEVHASRFKNSGTPGVNEYNVRKYWYG